MRKIILYIVGLTLQIMTKTNCCVEGKDKNVYNEDLESETEDGNIDDKQIIDKINSFHTGIAP